MIKLWVGRRSLSILGGAVGALMLALLLVPASGTAAKQYPDLLEPQSRSFDGGEGGWKGQAMAGGDLSGLLPSNLLSELGLPLDSLIPDLDILDLCGTLPLPLPILCEDTAPGSAIEWSHQPTGGAGNSGYLSSQSSSLVGVLGSAGTIWESPPFVYRGSGDQPADAVNFKMDLLADGGSLYSVLNDLDLVSTLDDLNLNLINLNLDKLEQVKVKVDLVSGSGMETETIQLINETPLISLLQLEPAEVLELAQTQGRRWETVGPVAVDPTKLDMGTVYAMRVTSTYDGLLGMVDALSEFEHGLDNVALTALPGATTQPGGPGAPGQPGAPGDSGRDGKDGGRGAAGALTVRQVRTLLNRAAPARAAVSPDGRWIRIAAACPKRLNKVCRYRTVASFKKRGARITRAKNRRVARGVRRTKALFVKPAARKKVKRVKRVFVHQVIRVGNRKIKRIKAVKLQQRAFRHRR